MMKILMLLDNPFRADARVEKEVKSLLENGYEVEIFAEKDDSLLPVEEKFGCTIHRNLDPVFKRPFAKRYREFLLEVSEMICENPFDFLHCHDYQTIVIGAMVKKKRPQTKLIYDNHEYLEGWPLYKTSNGILNQIKGYFVWKKAIVDERDAMKYADRIITISSAIAGKINNQTNSSNQPVVLRNVPDNFKKTHQSNYFRKQFDLSENERILVHAGSIYQTNRQLNQLFSILQEFENLRLIFVGNRPRFFEVKKMVKKKRELAGKIFFHDYPSSQHEMLEMLSSADIGLLHVRHKWEAHRIGFSNRFLEYSFAGLPVISTPQDECVKIGKQFGHAFFYHENYPLELRDAILNCLENLQDLKKKAEKVASCLNWKTEVKKLR